MPKTCAFLSFRLGLSDGVSIVAESWRHCLERMGWRVITVAGGGPVDHLIPWLAIGSERPPDLDELRAVLEGVDLVIVENLLTIPMNLEASRAVARVLRGRPVLLHHHDPPWQRERFAHITELPPTDPNWQHVTINRMTERELAARGIVATTILNGFAVPSALGDRVSTRAKLGVDDDTVLVVHPVRAIARKNIPAALRLAETLAATYWLTGPAEEGYDDTLAQLVDQTTVRVIHRSVADVGVTIPDLYAASDLVAFPSTWEGFGNPLIESALHFRPALVADYPVLAELRALGLEWIPIDDLNSIRDELQSPDLGRRRRNRAIAARDLSMEALQDRLQDLFDRAGW